MENAVQYLWIKRRQSVGFGGLKMRANCVRSSFRRGWLSQSSVTLTKRSAPSIHAGGVDLAQSRRGSNCSRAQNVASTVFESTVRFPNWAQLHLMEFLSARDDKQHSVSPYSIFVPPYKR